MSATSKKALRAAQEYNWCLYWWTRSTHLNAPLKVRQRWAQKFRQAELLATALIQQAERELYGRSFYNPFFPGYLVLRYPQKPPIGSFI